MARWGELLYDKIISTDSARGRVMQIYAGQNTYKTLGINSRWWLLLDSLDHVARLRIEAAVQLIRDFGLSAPSHGAESRRYQADIEMSPQARLKLRHVLTRIGAADIFGGGEPGGLINHPAAERFIQRHEAGDELLQRLTDQNPAYKSALGRVNALSAHVQGAEGWMGSCVTAGLLGGSLFLCHNIVTFVVSIPVALFASNMLMFAVHEIHSAALKWTVAGGLCARFERAVFNAVTTDVLVGALCAACDQAGYEGGDGADPKGQRRVSGVEPPVCPA